MIMTLMARVSHRVARVMDLEVFVPTTLTSDSGAPPFTQPEDNLTFRAFSDEGCPNILRTSYFMCSCVHVFMY